MARPRLLITGCEGTIGSILWRALGDEYDLCGIDRTLAEASRQRVLVDIADYEQLALAVQQLLPLAAIVHLAADPRMDADWPSVLRNNIEGTHNLYEIVQFHNIPRVVFASSNHVTGGYEGIPPRLHTVADPPMISPFAPIRPDGDYGVSKACGEAIARNAYELSGITSVCLRIGTVLRDDDPTKDERHRRTWLSHRDLVQLVRKGLTADITFSVYYGVSNNTQRFWDIANAEQELGYAPVDNAANR